jgi:UDP-3-O-[3-hydroxymyristoyl] glucosamine N-acyltransferase
MLGGQVGIADHLVIGDGAMIGAKSGVVSNVPAGEKWFGYPALPGRGFLRAMRCCANTQREPTKFFKSA